MIRPLWTASAEVRYFLRRYMPSNIVLDLIRTRKGLEWGIPAMLAGPYLPIAFWCTTLIAHGGPGWLHLVLVCIWNALKTRLGSRFVFLGVEGCLTRCFGWCGVH